MSLQMWGQIFAAHITEKEQCYQVDVADQVKAITVYKLNTMKMNLQKSAPNVPVSSGLIFPS